jgi:hypothetical protein
MNANQFNHDSKARLEAHEAARLQKRAERIQELNKQHDHQVLLGLRPIDVLSVVNEEEAAERAKVTKDQDLAERTSLLTGVEMKPQVLAPIPMGSGSKSNDRSQVAVEEAKRLMQ